MLILPDAFLIGSGVGVSGVGAIADSGRRVDSRSDGMRGNVRSRHRLTRRTGSRTSRIIRCYVTGSRMSRK
jgi:hypothetical protein